MMNEASLALMVSVGHRTGLFDVMASMPAATSAEIASRASLDERYVREWLAAMSTGRIVEHDGATGSYALPAGHAAWLTRAAGMNNLAVGMQYVGLMALVEDQIVDCFRRGGGVGYSAFPRFHAVMAEDSGAVRDATLIDVTHAPRCPGWRLALSHGHRRRRRRVRVRPRRQPDGRDVPALTVHRLRLFAAPRSPRPAWRPSAKAWPTRTSSNATPPASARPAGLDFITTFDAVHDQARPDLVLAGIAAALRPGGVYLCVDTAASSNLADNLDHPLGPFLYPLSSRSFTVSCMHCMTVSLADGGMGLGTMWGQQTALAMLTEAGFTSIRAAHLDGDIVNVYLIASKD